MYALPRASTSFASCGPQFVRSYMANWNRMWMLLTGSLSPHAWNGIVPSMLKIHEQNLLPYIYGGITSIGVEHGNEASKYGKTTTTAWRKSFFKRLRRHAARVCRCDHKTATKTVTTDKGDNNECTTCPLTHAPVVVAFSGKRQFCWLFSPTLSTIESLSLAEREEWVRALKHCSSGGDELALCLRSLKSATLAPIFMFDKISNVCTICTHTLINTWRRSNLYLAHKLKTKWSQDTLATLKKMSPLSLKLTLEQMLQGAVKTYAKCFQMENRMATRMMENPDFFEGVRAVVVDKYPNPKWDKRDINKVMADEVEKFFEPLDEDQELIMYPSVMASTHKKE
ncbi:hypothetical protein PsorP6_004876 [Peronosclerospora sorghi]|uniref:Uncharacterized protein n=1 Tax=Peronosclerospora sorghi TaxID=230839 RepID=A0ACC0W5F3_9STRA|nr:hypothetical protein PsorP6_004876 [Peronosclerospora sorghi]